MYKAVSFTEIEDIVGSLYQGKRTQIRPFTYSIAYAASFATLTSVTQTLKLLSNADFLLLEIMFSNNGSYKFQLIDSASNERFFQNPIYAQNAAMDQINSYFGALPFPRWIAGNSTIEATVLNETVGTLDPVSVVLRGVNVRVYS